MKGRFVISLDTEIAWGWGPDRANRQKYFPLYDRAHNVIFEIVDILEKYKVPATWALVGRLVDKKEIGSERYGHKFTELFKDVSLDSLYSEMPEHYLSFPELVDRLVNSSVNNDIGSHTYNHLHAQSISHDNSHLFRNDIKAMKSLFQEFNLTPVSLVYPRNEISFTDLLNDSSIKIYRGPDKYWYSNFPSKIKKIARQLDQLFPICPRVFNVKLDENNVSFINGSMLFKRNHWGPKRFIPMKVFELKAKKGIRKAIDQNGIFHLWFHPFNFSFDHESHFKAFEAVLKYAVEKRDIGLLEIVTMRDLVKD